MNTTIFLLFIVIAYNGQAQRRSQNQLADTGNIYALIIGVKQFQDPKLTVLQYADRDALNFYDFLKSGYIKKKFDTSHIKMLLNDDATYNSVFTALFTWLERLKDSLKAKDDLYVYWAGHGMVGFDDHHLVCQDTKVKNINLGDLKDDIGLSILKGKLRYFANKENIRVFLIVDACRSSSEDHLVDPSIYSTFTQPVGPGEVSLFSCGSNEVSFETKNINPGNGVFTYFLLLGLEGAADVLPPFGRVTYAELATFLRSTVLKYVTNVYTKDVSNPTLQNPAFYTRNEYLMGNVVLSTPPPNVVVASKEKAKRLMDSLDALQDHSNPGTAIHRGPSAGGLIAITQTLLEDQVNIPQTTIYDSTDRIVDSFYAALARNDLVFPSDHSAYDFFLELQQKYKKSKPVIDACSALFAALTGKTQKFLNQYLEGRLHDTKNDSFKTAFKELSTTLLLFPDDSILLKSIAPKLTFLQTRALAGSNNPADWKKGLDILDKTLNRSTRYSYLYLTKGILYHNIARYYTAIKYFDSARIMVPAWTFPLYNLATTYYQLQEYGKSSAYCDSVLKYDHQYSKAHSLRALNYEAEEDNRPEKDYERAIGENNLALQIDSTNAAAYINLGRIATKSKLSSDQKFLRALQYYRVGATLADENSLTLIGSLYFSHGPAYYDSAAYYFIKSLAINPFNVYTLSSYAFMLNKIQSDSLFLQALRNSEYDYKINNTYKKYLFVNVSPVIADSVFESIVKGNAEDPSIFIDHSSQYEKIDSLQKAKNILQRGLQAISNSPSIIYALGKLFVNHFNDSLFAAYALDSARYYFLKLGNIIPGYFLSNYGLLQISRIASLLPESDSYWQSMQLQTGYDKTQYNFSTSLGAHGDSMIVRKSYSAALNYYRAALKVTNEKNSFLIRIGRAYYLNHKLDSALNICSELLPQYLDPAELSNDEREDEEKVLQLEALTRTDYKSKRSILKAIQIFSRLDNEVREPAQYIEQAVCFFLLNKRKTARRLLLIDKTQAREMFKVIQNEEGIRYSSYFVNALKNLVLSVGDEFYSK